MDSSSNSNPTKAFKAYRTINRESISQLLVLRWDAETPIATSPNRGLAGNIILAPLLIRTSVL